VRRRATSRGWPGPQRSALSEGIHQPGTTDSARHGVAALAPGRIRDLALRRGRELDEQAHRRGARGADGLGIRRLQPLRGPHAEFVAQPGRAGKVRVLDARGVAAQRARGHARGMARFVARLQPQQRSRGGLGQPGVALLHGGFQRARHRATAGRRRGVGETR
jgi:hypothetical protein